jgi:hypothetical protein
MYRKWVRHILDTRPSARQDAMPIGGLGSRRDDRRRTAVASAARLLSLQFLQWVAARPRSDAETRVAWSSTCPLNCAWEDALAEELVRRTADGRVELTARGWSRLRADA